MKEKFTLSASVLKTIAIIFMVINHISTLPLELWDICPFLFRLLWCVTRISYPLFAFLLAEGMAHTHSREKYLGRLLLLAVISQPFYGWALLGGPLQLISINVFSDLVAGGCAIIMYEHFHKENRVAMIILLVALGVLSVKCNFSYNILGVLLPLIFYIFRENRKKLALISLPTIPILVIVMYCIGYGSSIMELSFFAFSEFCMVLALPLILLYNGKKGNQLPKWFYYSFYPAHLAIVGLLGMLL